MKAMIITLGCIIVCLAAAAALILILFSGEDHSQYDLPKHPSTNPHGIESAEHAAAAELVAAGMPTDNNLGRTEALQLMRQQMDARGEAMKITSTVHPVDVDGLDAEWVIAPNATAKRRLLYIHGGGYVMGSPKSHRLITSRLSEASGAVVLAIDQRLQPENTRMDSLEDCRKAYNWLLQNSPDSTAPAEVLFVAGDSSGGNLALATIAWARDAKIRAADAVVVFAPQTDATLGSPSLIRNTATDLMQGASFGPVVRAPKVFSLGFSFLMNRLNPSNPMVSPLLGSLENLPPTLVQVSEAEMFLDDAIRYVNKANAQGSQAVLQTWPKLMHVWQAFKVPEADDAFNKVEEFFRQKTQA